MKNYFKITNGNSVILPIEEAKEFLDAIIGEVGEKYKIEVIEIEEDDFSKLPEFDGF